jgi:hypothetical protein
MNGGDWYWLRTAVPCYTGFCQGKRIKKGPKNMARKVNLTVNETSIELNEFLEAYFYHVAGGIIASLKDTEAIKKLKLDIDNTGDVKIILNGKDIPVNIFVTEIVRNTLGGMVGNLKGVNGKLKTLSLRIEQ